MRGEQGVDVVAVPGRVPKLEGAAPAPGQDCQERARPPGVDMPPGRKLKQDGTQLPAKPVRHVRECVQAPLRFPEFLHGGNDAAPL